MFTRNIRLTAAAAAVVLGVLSVPKGPAPAAAWFLGAALLALGYYRHGTVWLAFRAQKQGDSERARRLLQQIARPDWLAPQSQAYYDLLAGIHALEQGAHDASYAVLTRLETRNLRTDADRALRQGVLAAASLALGERERARIHLQQARNYPLSSQLGKYIETLEGDLAGSST